MKGRWVRCECGGECGAVPCWAVPLVWLVEVHDWLGNDQPLDSLIAQSIMPPVRALFTWVPYLPPVSMRILKS
jgi:hypothetical protein